MMNYNFGQSYVAAYHSKPTVIHLLTLFDVPTPYAKPTEIQLLTYSGLTHYILSTANPS